MHANKMSAFFTKLKRFIFKKEHIKSYRLNLFFKDFEKFENLDVNKRFPLRKEDMYPCLEDNTATTNFDAHYVFHPAWAARIIKKIDPAVHIDISSTLHFCTMLSAFVKTEFYDYRPAVLNLDNLKSKSADLTNLPFLSDSIVSLSCMHTIEHIGLGRYGDPLDPEGDLKAFAELKRVCAANGTLLIVVPVGVKRIQFNAHRVYDPFDILDYMTGFEMEKFSLINDNSEFIDHADLNNAAQQKYGCGCYWFIKQSK